MKDLTSKMAMQSIDRCGTWTAKNVKDKALIDTISATIMLQSYLESIKHKKQLQ